jgi:uncharacterized protein (DUF302 family)
MPSAAPSEITTKVSRSSVGETVSRLVDLISSKGMKVFAVIDQRAEAQAVGLDLRETVLVLFGSPQAGTPVMEAVPLVAVDLPLKVLVWSDGATCQVSYTSPSALAARFGLGPDVAHAFDGIDALTDVLVASDPEPGDSSGN